MGRMGQLHADTISASSQATLVATADAHPRAREHSANRYRVPAFESLALLLEASLDAVIIASNTPAHGEHIEACANAGVAIFVEKPSALSMEASEKALARVAAAGVPFQIGFQRRFDSRYREMKRVISSGAIGTPVLFTGRGRDPDASSPERWGIDQNGGLLLNCAIHDFDAARYLLGAEPTAVAASATTLVHHGLDRVGDFDVCSSTVFFGDDRLAITEWSRFATYGYDIQAEVIGTDGIVRLQGGNVLAVEVRGGRATAASFFGQAYRASLEGFMAAVQDGTATSPGVDDARTALQVALFARASAMAGGARLPLPALAALPLRGGSRPHSRSDVHR